MPSRAFDIAIKANNALQNTSGVSFSGNVNVPSGNVSVGTNVARTRMTVSGLGFAAATPTLGIANGTVFLCNQDTNYGLMFGTNITGHSWVQSQRVDGTATSYDLYLQPSGGNISIGATTPVQKLHIGGGPTNYVRVDDTSNNVYNLFGSSYGQGVLGTFSNHILSIYANSTERARIDTAGRLSVFYQPAFFAAASGTQSFSGATTPAKVDFSTGSQFITSNKSSGWSQANSRFTAPIAGTYEFTVSFVQTGTTTGPAAFIYKNGISMAEIVIGYYTAYATFFGKMLLDLQPNDYVEFWISNYNNSTFNIDRGRTYFSGQLLS